MVHISYKYSRKRGQQVKRMAINIYAMQSICLLAYAKKSSDTDKKVIA